MDAGQVSVDQELGLLDFHRQGRRLRQARKCDSRASDYHVERKSRFCGTIQKDMHWIKIEDIWVVQIKPDGQVGATKEERNSF